MPPAQRPVLCPRCRRIVGSADDSCPWCGLGHPRAWWRRLAPGEGLLAWILYANVLMYGVSLLIAPPSGLLSPNSGSLALLGATGSWPLFGLGRWWTLLSANYLHGGVLHLVFNMMALRQIGPLAAREYGPSRAAALYTLGGAGGFLISCLAGVRFTIGASAAVCSLIGAMLYYGKSRGGSYGQALYSQLGGWVLSLFVFGFLFPGINNWGHGGGLACGAALGWALGYQERRREGQSDRLLALACLGLSAAALLWGVGGAAASVLRR